MLEMLLVKVLLSYGLLVVNALIMDVLTFKLDWMDNDWWFDHEKIIFMFMNIITTILVIIL